MATQALLPGALRLAPSYAFAGRADELATLRALLPRATGEGRRAAFVAGEAGSGKSRLVRELAHDVAAEGATVLYGDCDGVVRRRSARLPRRSNSSSVRLEPEALGSAGPELRRLLPGIGPAGGAGERLAADADAQRLRLHTAVTDVLTESARSAPVLLVLEDVHWADAPTLLLLRHLVRERRRRAPPARRHLPRLGRRGDAGPRRRARRRLPDRGCRPDPARRAHDRRGGRVRPARRRHRADGGADRDPRRADRRQRVPPDGALARARRVGRDRRPARRRGLGAARGRGRGAADRAGDGGPAGLAPRAGDDLRARARRRGRCRLRARDDPACQRPAGRGAPRRRRRGGAERARRRGVRPGPRVPVRARARAARGRRPALGRTPRRDAPAGRGGPRADGAPRRQPRPAGRARAPLRVGRGGRWKGARRLVQPARRRVRGRRPRVRGGSRSVPHRARARARRAA